MTKTIILNSGKKIKITRKSGNINFEPLISFDELQELKSKGIV